MDGGNLPDNAKHTLCRAHLELRGAMARMYVIDRRLGWKVWGSQGTKGRSDMAALYANGLIQEWHAPDGPPCFLTPSGVVARAQFRKELGYDG